MRLKKDETRDLVLEKAEEEFLKRGFREASLRNIAMSAGVTTGAIYTYFKSKDDLFERLVSSAVRRIESVLEADDVELSEARGRSDFNPQRWFTKNLRFLMEMIEEHRVAMTLLLLKAEGSRYHGYRSKMVERGAKRSAKVFKSLSRSSAFEGQQLSTFFVRNLAGYVIEAATDMLRQGCSSKEMERYETEISAFLFSGWRALVEI